MIIDNSNNLYGIVNISVKMIVKSIIDNSSNAMGG